MQHLSLIHGVARAQVRVENAAARIASGLRVRRAADDVAGIGVIARRHARLVSFARAERNVHDVVSALHVADGALGEIGSNLIRMRELATRAASGSLGAGDRAALQTEFAALRDGIDAIARGTSFQGMRLLDGSLDARVAVPLPAQVTAGVAQTQALAKKEKLAFDDFGIFAGLGGNDRQLMLDAGDTQADVIAKINAHATIGGLVQASVDASGRLQLTSVATGAGTEFRVVSNRAAAADTTGIGTTAQLGAATESNSGGGLAVQVGIGAGPLDRLNILLAAATAEALALDGATLATAADATAAMAAVDGAQRAVADRHAGVGAWTDRLGSVVGTLQTAQVTTAESLSLLRDADLARETAELTQARLQHEHAVAVLAAWGEARGHLLALLAPPEPATGERAARTEAPRALPPEAP